MLLSDDVEYDVYSLLLYYCWHWHFFSFSQTFCQWFFLIKVCFRSESYNVFSSLNCLRLRQLVFALSNKYPTTPFLTARRWFESSLLSVCVSRFSVYLRSKWDFRLSRNGSWLFVFVSDVNRFNGSMLFTSLRNTFHIPEWRMCYLHKDQGYQVPCDYAFLFKLLQFTWPHSHTKFLVVSCDRIESTLFLDSKSTIPQQYWHSVFFVVKMYNFSVCFSRSSGVYHKKFTSDNI